MSARACGQDGLAKFKGPGGWGVGSVGKGFTLPSAPSLSMIPGTHMKNPGIVMPGGRIEMGRLKVKPMAHELGEAEAGGQPESLKISTAFLPQYWVSLKQSSVPLGCLHWCPGD